MLAVVTTLIVFVLLVGGVGFALAPRRISSSLLACSIGIGLSLVTVFMISFGVYWLKLPGWSAPVLLLVITVVAFIRRRDRAKELWMDAEVRNAALMWAALLCWLSGWQFSVVVYSGGSWAGDWGEHMQRARFFADGWPLDFLFLERYSITARPPLLNVVGAFFLWTTDSSDFAVFQTVCATTASLVIWPMFALQRLFGQARPGWLLAALMCLPALIQHATFTWTKAQTAFFILIALALIRSREDPRQTRRWTFLCLAAACITHYSAVPWIVGIGIAMICAKPTVFREVWTPSFWVDALPGIFLLSTWFGWSISHFGLTESLTSNSTMNPDLAVGWDLRVQTAFLNTVRTFVPVFFIGDGMGPLYSLDPLVQLRDSWFYFLQCTVPGLAGTTGAVLAGALLIRDRHTILPESARFWASLLLVGISLGIITVAQRVEEGVAHISLLTLALIAVSIVSTRAPQTRTWLWIWMFGLTVDFVMGILLHFGLESGLLLRLLHPEESFIDGITRLGPTAESNLKGYAVFAVEPIAVIPAAAWIALTLLVTGVVLALASSRQFDRSRPHDLGPG